MQNNDPKHTSYVAKDIYVNKGINWWPTPASSADFNPIERVWREKPLSKKELVELRNLPILVSKMTKTRVKSSVGDRQKQHLLFYTVPVSISNSQLF